ncbi:MAG: MMPL family transporter [Vulcanimicrobiota bacterium]
MRLTFGHSDLVLALTLVSVIACLFVAVDRIQFSTDRTQLLGPEDPVQKSYGIYRDDVGGNADIVVLVIGTPLEVQAAIDQLGGSLLKERRLFEGVFFKMEIPQLANHALYFLPYRDLLTLKEQLAIFQPWLAAMKKGLPETLARLERLPDEEAMVFLQRLSPILSRVLAGLATSVTSRGDGPYLSPLPAVRAESRLLENNEFKPGQTTFYNSIGSGRTCMLIARPTDRSGSFQKDLQTVVRLRELVADAWRFHPSVKFMVSGEPVIDIDEMVVARDDAVRCGLTALVLASLVLMMAFREPVGPLCAVAALLVGLCFSCAFAGLSVGTLNLLTVHFATILTALSLTFAVQLLSHFKELRSLTPGLEISREIWEQAVAEAGPGTFLGALGAAVAFWSLQFTNFRAAAELGLITGSGVLLTFFSMWVVLPILMERLGNRGTVRPLRLPGLADVGRELHSRMWGVLIAALFITLYSATWLNRVSFNYDLLSLQPPESESVAVEGYLQSLGYSSLYAVSTASSLERARQLTRRFQAVESVARVESVTEYLPLDVERKRPLVRAILGVAGEMGSLPRLDGFLDSGAQFRSATQLLRLQGLFQRFTDRLDKLLSDHPESEEKQILTPVLVVLKSLLKQTSPGPLEAGLRQYERQLTKELETYLSFLRRQKPSPPDLLAHLPEALADRSISKSGKFVLRIFPRADCWKREALVKFVASLRRVDPDVTGTPILIHHYLKELRTAYSEAGLYALAAIALFLLLHYRSLVEAGLALFPKLLAVVWMIGIMGVAGVSFNVANFLALPITMGIGLVFGINVLNQCRRDGVEALFESATANSVLLSGVVMTIGFASFIRANHLGVSSFGFVMAVGVAANILTSLMVLPAILGSWERVRRSRGYKCH